MTGEPFEPIRDSLVAEELAAQAGTEKTPPLFFSNTLQAVIFGPQRPPLAKSGYFPGSSGGNVAAAATFTSHIGLGVNGAAAHAIIRINSIRIINDTATKLTYSFRRIDVLTGFTLAALTPGYVDAGNPVSGGAFSTVRNNTVGVLGTGMGQALVGPDSQETYHGPWIINNGIVAVAVLTVNEPVRAYFNYEHWPSIRQQLPGG